MYLVTRADLPPGTQACQAVHAAIEFTLKHLDLVPDTLVVLAAPDELALGWLYADAVAAGLRVVPFHEPDLGHALTAAAFEPAAARRLAHLPLALSRGREVKT